MICKLCENDWIENYSQAAVTGVCRVCLPKHQVVDHDILRLYQMAEMRYEQRKTYQEIGEAFQITGARVRALIGHLVEIPPKGKPIKTCRCGKTFQGSNKFCSIPCRSRGEVCKCGSTENLRQNGGGVYYCKKCINERRRKYYQTDSGKQAIKKALEKQYILHPRKTNARQKLNYYVQMGRIKKPKKCQDCKQSGRIYGHHKNYNKPLDVMWLCSGCHASQH